MKTLAVFAVSFAMLLVTLKLCAQTATPAPTAAPTPARPATSEVPATTGEAATAVDATGAEAAAPKKDAGEQDADNAAAPGGMMDAQDVARKLLTAKRRQAVVPAEQQIQPTDPSGEVGGVAPPELVRPIPDPPGSMIVNRLGRLRRDASGEGWTFHFEADHEILYEPPVGVLPNRMLEAMENILEKAGQTPVLFKVTGEITSYRGQRFILVRRMIAKRDTGAL